MSNDDQQFNYQEDIHELAKELCERDDLNQEMNFGQAKEALSEMANIFADDETGVKFSKFMLYCQYKRNKKNA